MNRHHPYGGSFESPAVRRGGSPSGPGPDRSHRYQDRGGAPPRGRGMGRGRGGYSNFDGSMSNHGAYDQGHPQGDMGAYNNYEAQGAPQDPFYQNNNYGGGPPAQFTAPPMSAGFNQGFGKFEDGAGSSFDDDGGFGRGGRRPIRKERDDKVHDSIIEERIQRERPCRTLFIRNIKYETNSDDVRHSFEEHGEIKTFFDLISTRGMVFVTYYDLRAAERARERLQGSEISGRPIDVHYSLPRDDHSRGNDRDKNQQLQGTLQVTLRNSPSGQAIDDNEVRRKFQQFGDVKSVKPVGDRIDSRYVEFYDTRACDESFDRLRHQGLQDGVMDIVFAWDVNEGSGQPGSQRDGGGNGGGSRDWDDGFRGSSRGGGGGGGGGGRGRGGRGRGRGRGYDDDYDRRGGGGGGGGDYGRPERDGRGRGGGRYDDDNNRGGRGGGGYGDRYDNNRGGYGGAGPSTGYGNGAPTGFGAPPPPPPVPAGPPDDRLEQARKVQQLLAALKQPQNGTAPTGPPAPVPPPGVGGMPGMPPMQPPPQNPGTFYPPFHGTAPPNNSYGAMGQPPAAQPAQPPANPLSGLPPNILALLQSTQQQQQPRPPPASSQYGMPPPPMMNTPPPPPNPNPAAASQYQSLMTYLQSQATAKP